MCEILKIQFLIRESKLHEHASDTHTHTNQTPILLRAFSPQVQCGVVERRAAKLVDAPLGPQISPGLCSRLGFQGQRVLGLSVLSSRQGLTRECDVIEGRRLGFSGCLVLRHGVAPSHSTSGLDGYDMMNIKTGGPLQFIPPCLPPSSCPSHYSMTTPSVHNTLITNPSSSPR